MVRIHPGQPTRDVAQVSRAARSHRAGCRRDSGRPDQVLIVPERKVVERSPSQSESLAGASPARNASFSARGSRGIADPPDSESGSLERASRFAPTNSYSRVAQQWSRRLLTGRLVVRFHPREPASQRRESTLSRWKKWVRVPSRPPFESGRSVAANAPAWGAGDRRRKFGRPDQPFSIRSCSSVNRAPSSEGGGRW
jgi:hypothetical protein